MFSSLFEHLRSFRRTHRGPLALIFVEALPRCGTSILFALLTVMIADVSNAAIAGIAFSGFAVFEMFVTDPLGGTMADRFGSRLTLRVQALLTFATGLLLLVLPKTFWAFMLIGVTLFTCYGLRMMGAYLLRMIKRNEGGFIFGLSETTVSCAYFVCTMSIPFFARNDRSPLIAYLLMLTSTIYFIVVSRLPDDRKKIRIKHRRKGSAFNPWDTIRHGVHFIRRNEGYPLMPLMSAFFEGIFYSTVWFVFPLRFAELSAHGGTGLEMGIYDLVTLSFAGLCGYLADRYNWKLIHGLGWLLILVGSVVLPNAAASITLTLTGLVIAVGNNLSHFSAEHVLTKFDIDHREDGSFMALMTMVGGVGAVVSPIIAGYLYYHLGFSAGIGYACMVSAMIAVFMIWRMRKLNTPSRKATGQRVYAEGT